VGSWLKVIRGRNVKLGYLRFTASDHFENPARTSNKYIVGEDYRLGEGYRATDLAWFSTNFKPFPSADMGRSRV